MKYRAEIDGLRALAVLTVVVFHFFPGFLELGYLGVDIFFVISGYLITTNLFDSGSLSYSSYLKRFYERRLKRLFPALFVFLCVTSFVVSLLFLKNDLESFRSSVIATQTFWANWFFWRDGGYFGGNDQLKPLLHMWSLSVEEQFYIIYPSAIFILIMMRKKISLNPIFGIVLATFLSLLGWFYLNRIGGENPAFFLLPTRAWQFGFGAIVAYIHFNNRFASFNKSSLLAFASVLILVFSFIYSISQIVNTFLVTFGAALFVLSQADPKSGILRLFSNRLSVAIGKISYSLYLYHWPIAVILLYVSIENPSFLYSFLGLILSFILAWISYRVIERPFRYNLTFRYTLMVVVVASSISLISTSLAINNSEKTLASDWAKSVGTHFRCEVKSYIAFGSSRACVIGDELTAPTVAVLGNSHAQMYSPLVDEALREQGMGGLLIPLTGCLPTTAVNLSQSCFQQIAGNFDAIANDKTIKLVLIASTWYGAEDIIDKEGKRISNDELIAAFDKLIEDFIRAGKRVALFSPIQIPATDIASELPRLLKFGCISQQEAIERLKAPRASYDLKFYKINEHFKSILGNAYITVYNDLCDENYCLYGAGNEMFFADSNHISQLWVKNLFNSKKQILNFLK